MKRFMIRNYSSNIGLLVIVLGPFQFSATVARKGKFVSWTVRINLPSHKHPLTPNRTPPRKFGPQRSSDVS